MNATRQLDGLRFLEMGPAPLVKTVFPEQTEYFRISQRRERNEVGEPVGLRRLTERLRAGDADLVICQPPVYPLLHHQGIVRMFFNRRIVSSPPAPSRGLAVPALRMYRSIPLAVMDLEDHPYIDNWNFRLLDRATAYFKRELPTDEWRVFTKTGTPNQPTPRFRRIERFKQHVAKLRPLPLGLPHVAEAPPESPLEKVTDVFFAAHIPGMPVRERGLAELKALQAQGLRIDICETRIPRDEFYRRCAQAWLTWSPEGYGWDCFRHYEAPMCGSVPMHNYPNIRRHAPTEHGVQAFYHGAEAGALTRCIHEALADKQRLMRMAAAARAHCEAHHTREAIVRHVIETTLALAGR